MRIVTVEGSARSLARFSVCSKHRRSRGTEGRQLFEEEEEEEGGEEAATKLFQREDNSMGGEEVDEEVDDKECEEEAEEDLDFKPLARSFLRLSRECFPFAICFLANEVSFRRLISSQAVLSRTGALQSAPAHRPLPLLWITRAPSLCCQTQNERAYQSEFKYIYI